MKPTWSSQVPACCSDNPAGLACVYLWESTLSVHVSASGVSLERRPILQAFCVIRAEMMKKLSRMVFTGWSFGEDLWIYLVLTAGHMFAFLLCALELVWHLYVPPDLSWPIISALWCCYKAMNSQLAQPSGFRSQKIHTVNNVYTPL